MNKLLILALIVLISIIIWCFFNEIEREGMGNELSFIQKEAQREINHNNFNKIKLAMNSPDCIDNIGCKFIDPSRKKILTKQDGMEYKLKRSILCLEKK